MRKKVAILCLVLIGTGTGYVGCRLTKARLALEQYKQDFGYATPTEGLADCVFENSDWRAVLVDSTIAYTDGAHNIEPYDVDGDGTLELIANSYRSDTLATYTHGTATCDRNPGGWIRGVIDHEVGGGFPRFPAVAYAKACLKRLAIGLYVEGAHYTAIGDLSGDDRPDLVVAGDLTRYDVVWYEALSCPGAALSWKKHIAYRNDSHRTYHVETGDIDGDGDRDIVFTTKTDNSLGWLENRRVPGVWPATMVDSSCIRCFNARVIDADRDGRGEILASRDDWRGAGGRLHLYRHSGNPKNVDDWRRYDVTCCPPGCGISVFILKDMDRDGDLDVAAANHQGDVLVLRNPYPDNVFRSWDTWFARKGFTDGDRDFRDIDVGDIDLDGDPDIIVADEKQNTVLWLENPGEVFSERWPEHAVDQSSRYLRWCHAVRLGDMDNDGDLDVAVAAAASNVFIVYLNQALPK